MTCSPGVLYFDSGSDYVFPDHHHGEAYTPVDIPIRGCGLGGGLAMLPQGPAHVVIPIRTHGHPDSNLNWVDSGWWLNVDVELRYESRDENFLYGVTKYPRLGKIDAGIGFGTGYWNPNAYWVPPTADPVPPEDVPPGGDPGATYGQDPTTTEPPDHTTYVNKPFKYATLKTYDFMGVNRTGMDLNENPDDEGTFFDPYDSEVPVLAFVYDDQRPEGFTPGEGDTDPVTNLKRFHWQPDGSQTRNQQVSLQAAHNEKSRGIKRIARNLNSWHEIGVYSGWDAINGSNVQDVSPANVAGYAKTFVERYGRPPSFFELELPLEPADGWPARGETGFRLMPFRDFDKGDRVLARCRIGFLDTGLITARIMSVGVAGADQNGNVKVTVTLTPHMTDWSEISVWPHEEDIS